jgi:uncharacterized protein
MFIMRMCLRVSVLAGLLTLTAAAVDWKALKPQGYVSDFAQVVDAASRSRIEAYCASVERATGVEIALVTVPGLGGEPVEDVANTIYRAWGVGKKGKNEGALLLLSIQDRRSRLEVGYGLEPVMPDGFAGSVLREMRPALREGKYGEALAAAAETIGQTAAKAKNTTIEGQAPRQSRPSSGSEIPWGALVAGAVVLFLIFRSRGPRGYGGGGGGGMGGFLAGMILSNMLNRGSWGSRGSGGFGGSDSGDSFGGFGGGDSGGGGASSDW